VVNRSNAPRVYWMLNKPDCCLTAREDNRGRATIFDLPKLKGLPFIVSPVGRLDFRTEGLLLLSNDGELVHRLTHPSFKVPRCYHVLVNGKLTKEQEKEVRIGVTLTDGPVKGTKLRSIQKQNMGATPGQWYDVTVTEGRNRLVRRIFEHFDLKVVRLVRYQYGELELPSDLAPGEYLQLSSEQIRSLRKATDLK
jgi:23S rRNA pseudouridine2605 synthase